MLTEPDNNASRLKRFLDILRCPVSGEPLTQADGWLTTLDEKQRYRLNEAGIPLFAEQLLSPDAAAQQQHYEKIAAAYTTNLEYPHTQEYLAYLDRVTLAAVGDSNLGTVAELCCGRGEVPALLGRRIGRYIGIDIAESMLRAALTAHAGPNSIFLQADATRTPLAAESVDTVVMLGGIHHVPARAQLFSEIARILKPGGRLLYREPVNDFVLWRLLRAIIYRISPILDDATERPLVYAETVPLLEKAGLRSLEYRTHGLFGFCLFMNSDVLFFNRFFRFVPGIRGITRASARLDEMLLALPGLDRAGLQVVGLAQKV